MRIRRKQLTSVQYRKLAPKNPMGVKKQNKNKKKAAAIDAP